MKKLLTILALAIMLCLLCSAAMADIRYVASIEINQDTTTKPYPDVTIKIPSKKINIRNVEYDVTGISFSKNAGYVAPDVGLTVPQTKANCEKEMTIYVEYNAKDSTKGYEGYVLIPVRHIWIQQEPHTQTEATFKCDLCGKTKTDTPIHNYKQVITKAPTCVEDGIAVEKCSCGKTRNDGVTIKGGHDWEKFEIAPECIKDKAPADWKKGAVGWKCKNCGSYLKGFSAAGLIAHPGWEPDWKEVDSYPNLWVSATEYKADFTVPQWKNYINDATFDGHLWSEWKLEPATCDKAGYKVRWCKRCDKNEITGLTPADGDFFVANQTNLGPKWEVRLNVENLICTYTDAANYGKNKDVYIVCSRCNGAVEGHTLAAAGTAYTYTYYPTTGNFVASGTHTNTVTGLINANKTTAGISVKFTIAGDDPATLTANAAHVYEYKNAYAKWYNTYTFGAADASDMTGFTINVNGYHVPATCTNRGFTDYYCKYDTEDDHLMNETHAMKRVWDDPAPGHKFGKWVTEYDPSTTEPTGWYHRKCEICNYAELSHATAKPCDVHEPMNVEVIPVTCTTDGTYKTICKVCGADMDLVGDGITKAEGHKWTSEVVTAATCTTAGKDLYTCSVCGETKTEPSAAKGHKVTAVAEVPATHTATGTKAHFKCDVCGKLFLTEDDAKANKEAADLVIPANKDAHDWKNAKEEIVKEATCKEAGKKLLTCECGATKTETIDQKTEHAALVEVAGKEPTCKDTGLEACWKCPVCEKLFADKDGKTEIAEQKVIAVVADAHVKGELEAEVKPTCEKAGKKVYTCTVCGKTITEAVPATGHDWGEWEVTTPATLEKDGEATRVCKNDAAHKETKAVKFVPTAPAKYEVKDLDYTNPVATGSVELDPETKALTKAYARVTFFVANGDCMIQIVDVDEAGSFTAGAIGNFTHVSVIIVDDADAYGAEEAIEHAHGNGGIEL